MSLLKKLHKKIYQENTEIEKRKLEKDSYDPTEESIDSREDTLENIRKDLYAPDEETSNNNSKEMAGESKISRFVRENKRMLLIGLGIFSFVFLTITGILIFAKYKESLFDPAKVVVSIEGPENIESGTNVKYKIKINSDNKVELENAVLKINFSKELIIKENPHLSDIQFGGAKVDIGKVGSKSEKEYEFDFEVFGAKDFQGYVEAKLSYKPENFSSSFESKGQIGFSIKSSVLELTLIPTREAASGEMIEIQAVIENKGENVFDEVVLSFEYPMGFSFSESQPEPNEKNNYWVLGSVGAKEQKKVIIKGSITGETNSVKNFSAMLGQSQGQGKFLAFTNADGLVKITTARLQLTNIFGGGILETVKAGDVINTVLKFKNTSNEPLRDLILIENISSPVIDKAGFVVKNGFYDSAKEQIIWKASQVPSLKVLNPQEEGQVEFTFKINGNFPMESEKDKNFTVDIQPEIESLDVDTPLGQNKKVLGDKLAVKVASKLVLDVSGAYNDGEISNSGPYPPKVGEKTTLTMRLNLRNTSNDLRDAVLYVDLPAGVAWEDKFLPDDQKVEFDERTNQLTWQLGTISAGTGFISPLRNLAFQIGLTPSENQLDPSSGMIPLVAGIKVTASDVFTGKTVDYFFDNFKVGQLSDY